MAKTDDRYGSTTSGVLATTVFERVTRLTTFKIALIVASIVSVETPRPRKVIPR